MRWHLKEGVVRGGVLTAAWVGAGVGRMGWWAWAGRIKKEGRVAGLIRMVMFGSDGGCGWREQS